MDTQSVYIILAIFAILVFVFIFLNPKGKAVIKILGASLKLDGGTGAEQPRESKVPSAETEVVGKLSGSTVITSARGGEAKTSVGEDVEDSDILTET